VNRVSFVVPTRNAARTLAACLASIRAQQHDDVECIVVDNASDDDTVVIAERYADLVVDHGPERCAQRNRGAELATGAVLVFADADMVFDPGVAGDVHAWVGPDGDPGVGAVVIPELAFGDGFWARCRVLEKELYLGDPAVEAARGVRADDFRAVGGYDERFVGGEDWDLADRLVAMRGRRIARTESCVWHDEGRIALGAAFTKKRYYGRGLVTYYRTADRRPVARRVFREPARAARRPVLAAGLAVLKTVEFSGAALGMLDERRAS
jgi:glycosyltransferase involved in cell wall biosynthesis